MKKKILIFAPYYDDRGGGVVVSHKLCSILNQIGYQSFLHPYFESYILNKGNYVNSVLSFMGDSIKSVIRGYKINPIFETPVIYSIKDINWSIIYNCTPVEDIKVNEDNILIDCIVTTKTGKKLATLQASHQFKLYTGLEFPL